MLHSLETKREYISRGGLVNQEEDLTVNLRRNRQKLFKTSVLSVFSFSGSPIKPPAVGTGFVECALREWGQKTSPTLRPRPLGMRLALPMLQHKGIGCFEEKRSLNNFEVHCANLETVMLPVGGRIRRTRKPFQFQTIIRYTAKGCQFTEVQCLYCSEPISTFQ